MEATIGLGSPELGGSEAAILTTDLTHADALLRQAVVSHIITAKHAAPMMIRARRGLIVEVTEGDTLFAGGNPLTQTVKLAIKGLAINMAPELHPYGVTAVAIAPATTRLAATLAGAILRGGGVRAAVLHIRADRAWPGASSGRPPRRSCAGSSRSA